MIPNATQERAEAMLRLYAEAEEELLGIISRRLGRVKGDPAAWAQRKLEQVRQLRGDLEKALDSLEKQSLEKRVKLMWAAHDEGADGLLRELGLEDAHSARSQASVALIDDVNERFSELHRRILRDALDVYRDTLAKALPQAVLGVETTQQAIRRALNAFADRGITAFVDKAGRRWGMAEYAEMAVRTGMMNAALAGYTQEALAHGEDLVIITDHADECPLCAPWERRVLSLTGAQAGHPDCTGTIADARAAGLFHPNCLHAMTVYVPGLTVADGSKPAAPYQGSSDERGYRSRQDQRYMERMVRRWKRRQAVATTPEEERLARAYVVKWQSKLRGIADSAKLPRKYSREGGRVLLSDAAKKLKPLIISPGGGIIKTEPARKITVMGTAIRPMPKKQLQRIIKAFRRKGGVISMSPEVDEHLEKIAKATGATLGSDTILLHSNPSRATVFEELIHAAQYRDGKMDGSEIGVTLCEIEAKEKLIRHAKAYRLTDAEVQETKILLRRDYEVLANLQKGVSK